MTIIITKDIDNISDAVVELTNLKDLIGEITLDEIAGGVTINVEILGKE